MSDFESTSHTEKTLIGVCGTCGIAIYDEGNIAERTPKLKCNTCRLKELEAERRRDEESKLRRKKKIKSIKGAFIKPAIIISIIWLIISIIFISTAEGKIGEAIANCALYLLLGALVYLATVQFTLGTEPISSILSFPFEVSWLEIGVIFDLSVEGFIGMIIFKILWGLLALLIKVLLLIICAALCLIIAPFSFIPNVIYITKNPEAIEEL